MNLPGRPGFLLRAFFRGPLLMYRCGLGGLERLVGIQFVLLTTTGRRSGKPRSVMLDMMDHDEETDCYYVESGWGRRSSWVRNIAADPNVTIQVGQKRFRARATELSPKEGAERLITFYKRHPFYTRVILKLLEAEIDFRDEAAVRRKFEKEALVFRLQCTAPQTNRELTPCMQQ